MRGNPRLTKARRLRLFPGNDETVDHWDVEIVRSHDPDDHVLHFRDEVGVPWSTTLPYLIEWEETGT